MWFVFRKNKDLFLNSNWSLWGKIHILSKNLHFQNHIVQEIHLFKISFLAKFTFSKSHFQQNRTFKITFSQKLLFQNRIFHRNHILEVNFSQKSNYLKCRILVNLWIKSVILPQCVKCQLSWICRISRTFITGKNEKNCIFYP